MQRRPLMRIPYTGALPAPVLIPQTASTVQGAIAALTSFLSAPPSPSLRGLDTGRNEQTVLLTGAGISVASGLADYRGENGTYTQNKSYRPVYYHEFIANHEARKRYWARSFLGWTTLNKSRPNKTHYAVKELGERGYVSSVITQNVDSFHHAAHPELETLELHGYLRSLACVNCGNEMPRDAFQERLAQLNPTWAAFLLEMIESGALDTENPDEKRRRGLKSNPDGDVDVPGAPYTTFRYPACPSCLARPPTLADGSVGKIAVDDDGAWDATRSTAGILKPAVVMFGESIATGVKVAAEEAVDEAGKILIIGSSLATYSAWRLVKRAHDRGMLIGILNLGGVRKEEVFFDEEVKRFSRGETGVRCSQSSELVLPEVVERLDRLK